MTTRLQDLLALSHVPRWVTFPVARAQSVAEHSYRVAVLALEIRERVKEDARERLSEAALLRWALMHDGPESKFGDSPSPMKQFISEALRRAELVAVKWYNDEFNRPSTGEYKVVTLADHIEALSWISTYGSGFRDRFDGENIENKLRNRVHEEANTWDSDINGLRAAVQSILGEVSS